MILITWRAPNEAAFHGMFGALHDFFEKNPYRGNNQGVDTLYSNLVWQGEAGDISTIYDYVDVPGVPGEYDENEVEVTPPVPPVLASGKFMNMQVQSVECFEAFIAQGQLPGPADIICAQGLPFDEEDPSPIYPGGIWLALGESLRALQKVWL